MPQRENRRCVQAIKGLPTTAAQISPFMRRHAFFDPNAGPMCVARTFCVKSTRLMLPKFSPAAQIGSAHAMLTGNAAGFKKPEEHPWFPGSVKSSLSDATS